MKIAKGLRDTYNARQPLFLALANEVKDVLKPRAEERGWFYSQRVKQLESFALKVETGRVASPGEMEDFFACTIVVPTLGEIEDAQQLVLKLYDFIQRRPASDNFTHKPPASFIFDDLRLYVSQRAQSSGRNEQLDGLTFEVQIKTVLQHAWAVATHDLIYKSDTASWPRERIAYQVKAMLEHAEIAIAEANRLADAPGVAKRDEKSKHISAIVHQLRQTWSGDRLPFDVKRLAESILDLLKIASVEPDDLASIISFEKSRLGLLPADLSPYSFLIQALANNPSVDFQQKLKNYKGKKSIVVHGGMDLPVWLRNSASKVIDLDNLN